MSRSNSESWIEGLGGINEINQEMKEYIKYYLLAYNLPVDPQQLTQQSNHFNNNIICSYKVLHPSINIVDRRVNCSEFKKNIKFTIKYCYSLLSLFEQYCSNSYHGHLIDNTDLLYYIDIERFNDENKKIELMILLFNLNFRLKYMDNIPELSTEYLNKVKEKRDKIIEYLESEQGDNRVLLYILLLYYVNKLANNYEMNRMTAELFMIMSELLNEIIEEIDDILQRNGINQLLLNSKLKIIEQSNKLIEIARDIYREVNTDETMLSSFKDISSHDYSSSSYKESKFNENNILDKCNNIFKDINTTEGKKFKLLCHRLVDPKQCRDITKIRNSIFEYYSRQYPKIVEDIVNIEVDLDNIIESIFKAWIEYDAEYSQAESLFERSIFYENGFNIRQRGFQGVGEGTTRNTFTLLARALKKNNVFIPIHENSKRYTINYNYNINIGIENVPYERGTKSIKLLFWHFVGEFLQFCIVNNITLDFYLSYNLLYFLLVYDIDRIKRDNVLTYYFLDNNTTETKFLIESLRNPDNIDEYYDKFNSYTKLISKDKRISRKNFLEYIEMKAYYQLNNETYNKKYLISATLAELTMGFQLLKYTKMYRILNKNKVNVQTLDRLLSESNVNIENIKKFTESILYLRSDTGVPLLQCETGMKTIITYDENGNRKEEVNPAYNEEHEKIFENFKRILNNGLKTYPIDIENVKSKSETGESSNKKRKRSEEYLKFMKKLFHFWSASASIGFMPPMPYKIAIINRDKSLPSAHTCFYTIDIPDDIKSYKELYKKLVISVMNVEEELGLW